MFISFLYMFRTTMCPSSGEITVFMRHLVLVTLHSTLYTRQSSTQSDKYQVSHRYSYFSWWWAHSRPKHVEKRNKHTKNNCAPSWLYLQNYTGIHGQRNIKWSILNGHTSRTVRVLIPGEGKEFSLYQNPFSVPTLLQWVPRLLTGLKWPGNGVDHPHHPVPRLW